MQCWYCDERLTKKTRSREHLTPQCDGGGDDWTNVVNCCKRCNVFVGDWERCAKEKFRELLRRVGWSGLPQAFGAVNRLEIADMIGGFRPAALKKLAQGDDDEHAERRVARGRANGRSTVIPVKLSKRREWLLKEYPYCHGCCMKLTDLTAIIDRLVPKSAGGDDAAANLAIMCKRCKGEKAGTPGGWRLFNKLSKLRRKRLRRSGALPAIPRELVRVMGSHAKRRPVGP